MSKSIWDVTPEEALQEACSCPDNYIVIVGNDKRMTVKEFRKWLDTKPERINGFAVWRPDQAPPLRSN